MIEINGTFFIQLANFFVMIFFLNQFLFKPIMAVVEKRNKGINSNESETAKLKENGEKAVADYEEKIADVRKVNSEILRKGKQEASVEHDRIISEARAEFTSQVNDATASISKEAESAGADLQKEAESISKAITSKLLGRNA